MIIMTLYFSINIAACSMCQTLHFSLSSKLAALIVEDQGIDTVQCVVTRTLIHGNACTSPL